MNSKRIITCLAALMSLGAAAPAGAVVNGTSADPAATSWFSTVSGCGGTLVAPDRIVTAAHCVRRAVLGDALHFPVAVNGKAVTPTGVSMYPGWATHSNGDGNFDDDVAVVRLATPVTDVRPATLNAGPLPPVAKLLGNGFVHPPSSGAKSFGGGLHSTMLRTMTDAECAAAYKGRKGNGGEHFVARSMLCATDLDNKAPLTSGCNGDSGGPLYGGTDATPLLLGIVSYGGLECGQDRLPNVYADVAAHRAWILSPNVTWAPTGTDRAKVTGAYKVGSRLTCRTDAKGATKIAYTWKRVGKSAHTRTITVRKRDRGNGVQCFAVASNKGGALESLSKRRLIR